MDPAVFAVIIRQPHLFFTARAEPFECFGEAVALRATRCIRIVGRTTEFAFACRTRRRSCGCDRAKRRHCAAARTRVVSTRSLDALPAVRAVLQNLFCASWAEARVIRHFCLTSKRAFIGGSFSHHNLL